MIQTVTIFVPRGKRRKSLQIFARESYKGARWVDVIQPSTKQNKHDGRPRFALMSPDSSKRNDQRDRTRSWDKSGALVFDLGFHPPVRHERLVPLFDDLADAADRGDELPDGISVDGDCLLIESATLGVLVSQLPPDENPSRGQSPTPVPAVGIAPPVPAEIPAELMARVVDDPDGHEQGFFRQYGAGDLFGDIPGKPCGCGFLGIGTLCSEHAE